MVCLDANALKRERATAGLTQKELADRSNISYSTLTKLEQGQIKSPSVSVLMELAMVLGCTMADLLEASPLQIKTNSKISYVYFDVGGVLMHWLNSVQAFAERIDRPYHEVMRIFWQYNPIGCRGNMTFEDLIALFILELKVDFKGEGKSQVQQPWIEDMRPISAGHQLLRAVAEKYPVGLLTNVFKGYYPGVFARGLAPDIKYKNIVKSCDVGLIKPEKAIFNLAAQVAQVPAGEILLIDDTLANIRAARAAGWQAERFDEFQSQASVRRIVNLYFS